MQTLGLVLSQNLLDGLHALFRHIVEGCAALAHGMTLQGNGNELSLVNAIKYAVKMTGRAN